MLASSVPALVTCALTIASGAGWLSLFGMCRVRSTAWLGYSFALGVSWLAIATTALGALQSQANLVGIGAAIALPVVSAIVLRRRTSTGSDRGAERADDLRGWWGFAPSVCVVGLSFWLACQRPVWNIDAEKRWVMHGRWIAEYHTVLPDRVRDSAWTTTYPTYPPLVPALVGCATELGADPDMGVRPLFPIVLLALLACIHGYAHRTCGPKLASIVSLGLALTPCIGYLDRAGESLGLGADAAMADIPLAMLLTAGSILLIEVSAGADRGAVAASCLVFAGATLTKQEGSVSVLTILIPVATWAAWLGAKQRRRATFRACGACGVAVVLAAAAWTLLARGMPVETGNDYVNANAPGSFLQHFDRLPTVLSRVGSELVDWPTWGPLWCVALACIAWSLLRYVERRRRDDLIPALTGAWIFSGIVLAIGSYLVTGWKGGNYTQLMEVSLARVLMHHAPLVALMVCQLASPEPSRISTRRLQDLQSA